MNKLRQEKSFLKYLFLLIVLIVIDYIVIRFWVLRIDPEPSVSIGLMFLVPTVFVLNIIIAIILVFLKKQYAGLFFINSIIASIFLYFLFIEVIVRNINKIYESWSFSSNDTTFEVRLSKLDTTFIIYYKLNSSYSSGFIDGKYLERQNEYYLRTDTSQFRIQNNTLFGFSKGDIKLTKMR